MVSAGTYFTIGLKADGTLIAVGDNQYGQCNVTGLENIIAIDCGGYSSIAVTKNGRLVVFGSNSDGQLEITHDRLWD